MKVILLKPIKNTGEAGDVKDVSGGYFRNFLLPQRLAKPATPAATKEVEIIKRLHDEEAAKSRASLQALWEKLSGEALVLERKATAEGQLFGSVSESDIADAIRAKGYPQVQTEHILLESPLKSLGIHTVPLRLAPDREVSIRVEIQKSK